jgi:hypothetical protein
MTSTGIPIRGAAVASTRRANDNSAGWIQALTLTLDGITAGDYLSWVRDPDPAALGRELQAVAIDAAPLGDRIDLGLVWDHEPPDAETAAAIAGFPVVPEVVSSMSPPAPRGDRLHRIQHHHN